MRIPSRLSKHPSHSTLIAAMRVVGKQAMTYIVRQRQALVWGQHPTSHRRIGCAQVSIAYDIRRRLRYKNPNLAQRPWPTRS
jgi:hypothetical protein